MTAAPATSRLDRLIPGTQPLGVKVPQVTALFWTVKILTTGMGESTSDWLGETALVLGGLVAVAGLATAMWLQLRAPRYHAPTYWFAVAMVAVAGTIAADVLHKVLGVPYVISTAFWAIVVAALFTAWWRTEGTLSVHSIATVRRERFYWLTVLATFALGTAAGDLTGLTWGLGFYASGVLFGVLILVPLVAWKLGAPPVATFWTAYVLTRPLGASFADWLGKHTGGGLGYGDGVVTVVSTLVIVALVALLTLRDRSA